MCEQKKDRTEGCQGKQKNKDCSPEQIAECHGDSTNHPCDSTGGCEEPSGAKKSQKS